LSPQHGAILAAIAHLGIHSDQQNTISGRSIWSYRT
jgi:hypothetical protein